MTEGRPRGGVAGKDGDDLDADRAARLCQAGISSSVASGAPVALGMV